jgi:protein-tyrosine phosphatase
MAQFTRHIQVEGGYNIRDLGGYATRDGRVTRERRLIRAGNLHAITSQGQMLLMDYGIKTIIDLRHASELQSEPDVFAASEIVRYCHLSYAPDTFDPQPTDLTLGDLYCRSLGTYQTNIAAIIGAIAEAAPGVLYHCAVGKDRTGMISALLLGLAGVPVEVIAEDYAETNRHIVELVERWRKWTLENDGDMTLFERVVSADASTMLATMEVVETEYGGTESYLRSVGVRDEQIGRLRALLLD